MTDPGDGPGRRGIPSGADAPGSPAAIIVSIGDELLSGETVDTNAAWLGRHLATVGIRVLRRVTVGDDDDEIRGAVRRAIRDGTLVICSGGLGPTPDDRTKGAVAAEFGLEMVGDEETMAALRERYAAAGLPGVPAASMGQADVPEGSTALANPEGTAPGLLIRVGRATVVLLPGVPRELKAIVEGPLQPVLEAITRAGGGLPVHHRMIHTTGIAESLLAEAVEARLAAAPPATASGVRLAYLPDTLGVDLRFTVAAPSVAEAECRFDDLIRVLDEVLAPWRFDAASGDLAEALSDELRRRGWTLAVAESCTGGLVSKRMTDRAGASDVFLGGLVAYDDRVKLEQMGVSADDLRRHGAVSEVVAGQLAAGAARAFGADVGVGVTGVAGPGGGSEEKPVGLVWIGTAIGGVVETREHRLAGGRDAVRERAAQAALALALRRLARG